MNRSSHCICFAVLWQNGCTLFQCFSRLWFVKSILYRFRLSCFLSGLSKIKPGNDILFSLFVSIYDICIWICTKIAVNVVVILIESFYSLQTSGFYSFINTFCDVYKLDCNEWKLSVFYWHSISLNNKVYLNHQQCCKNVMLSK